MRRVYHPTIDTHLDVEDQSVKEWTESGWVTTKPEHSTASKGDPPVIPSERLVNAVDVTGQATDVEVVDLTPSNEPPETVTR